MHRAIPLRCRRDSLLTSSTACLRALVYSGRIELPDDPVLIAEAGRLRESNRGGSPRVETPRAGDSHCDLVVAVAAGVLEHEKHGAPPGREHCRPSMSAASRACPR